MSQINFNLNSQIAQRTLSQQQARLSTSLQRLSTGLQINTGKDNPAGLIAGAALQSQSTAITAAISNAQRADQVASIAEGGLQEVSSQLLQLQSLVTATANDAGLSDSEKQANQLQIDAILQSIDRISSTTSFAGTKLLNGTYDFNVSSVSAAVKSYEIDGVKLDTGSTVAVATNITASAQHGVLYLSAGGAASLTTGGENFSFSLAGNEGSRTFSFASGTTLASAATAINTFKDVIGVSAKASGNYLKFDTVELGSDQFVSLQITNDAGIAGAVYTGSANDENDVKTGGATSFAAATLGAVRDTGEDVAATINGVQAFGQGANLSVNTDALQLSLTLSGGSAQVLGGIAALTVTGGGATFSLGPTADLNNQVRLGLGSVNSSRVGSTTLSGTAYHLSDLSSGGLFNVVDGDVGAAQKVVNSAIDQIARTRGRIGSFQSNVVQPTINSLNVALENTDAAKSQITDTNFASETSNLTRQQVLVSAATSVLTIANSQPQSILRLLG